MVFEEETTSTNLMVRSLTGERQRRKPCFIVVGGSEVGRLYQIDKDKISIGRQPDCEIRVDDEAVSRYHATVTRIGDEDFQIEDNGSTNGTFCNGVRVVQKTLADGDKLLVGTTTILKFSYQDTTEIAFQEHLFASAVRDWLTQCYNKKYLEERLNADFRLAARHGGSLAIIIFDLDHFKLVNDTHGHIVGDYILKSVSAAVSKKLRREEFLARFGGEEFIVVARETGAAGAKVLAERCRVAIEEGGFEFEGKVIRITASFGIAEFANGAPASPEALISLADQALYRAKQAGRNRIELATPP